MAEAVLVHDPVALNDRDSHPQAQAVWLNQMNGSSSNEDYPKGYGGTINKVRELFEEGGT